MGSNRRRFLQGMAAVSGAAVLGSLGKMSSISSLAQPVAPTTTLPAPNDSGVDHLVVVMMENRSFDHLFGWMGGVESRQAGLLFPDTAGDYQATHSLAGNYTGCGHPDPDHSYPGGRTQYNNGQMNGFLLDSSNDVYSLGYYTQPDRPFHFALATGFTVFDRYFCSILGPTFPNRMFSHAAQTDRLSNTFDPSTLPTIWDSLSAAGVSAGYYFSNVPFLGLWGPKYIPISHPHEQFLRDAANGTLPAVSFVDPKFTVADEGEGNDDHPHADIRAGDAFLAQTFFAVAKGPLWPRTVFVITYDEWGGFFDHIAPRRVAAANPVDTDIVNGQTLLGFRIPVCVASPFTRHNLDDVVNANTFDPSEPRVNSFLYDHTSVLKFIEWRWNLAPLTPRDAASDITNLAYALKFSYPDLSLPALPNPSAPLPSPCGQPDFVPLPGVPSPPASAAEGYAWQGLLQSGILQGWNLNTNASHTLFP